MDSPVTVRSFSLIVASNSSSIRVHWRVFAVWFFCFSLFALLVSWWLASPGLSRPEDVEERSSVASGRVTSLSLANNPGEDTSRSVPRLDEATTASCKEPSDYNKTVDAV
jgi:hypothetical protein